MASAESQLARGKCTYPKTNDEGGLSAGTQGLGLAQIQTTCFLYLLGIVAHCSLFFVNTECVIQPPCRSQRLTQESSVNDDPSPSSTVSYFPVMLVVHTGTARNNVQLTIIKK